MKPEVIIDWILLTSFSIYSSCSLLPFCGCVSFLKLNGFPNSLLGQCSLPDVFLLCITDLRQELAVKERQTDVTRMSAPSSPTQDNVKMDTAVQASLSLPATPLSKGLDKAFANPAGSCSSSCSKFICLIHIQL